MPKRSITDFFKPYANSSWNNVSSPNDESTKPRVSNIERSPPQADSLISSIEEAEHPVASKDPFLISSQSSLLSSLGSVTPSTPDKRPSQLQKIADLLPEGIARARNLVEDSRSHNPSFPTSSQRIVKDGEIVVKDSDDERSDSDTSLEDLSNLFAPPKPINSSPRFPSDDVSIPNSRATKQGKQSAASAMANGTPSVTTSIPSYKFSLDALLRQSRQSEDSKTSIDNARHLLDSMEKRDPPPVERASKLLDQRLLETVMNDQEDPSNVQRLLVAIERTEALHQDEIANILVAMHWSLHNERLRLQLLRNLPASSPQLIRIRRRLALAFFFDEAPVVSNDTEPIADMSAIIRRLNQPRFSVNTETDYLSLAASIAILAIGLDNGDHPAPEDRAPSRAAFNESVDVLAQKIKSMFTQIVDTGASHMRRTEAKEVLESFHSCLVYAVRTTQKPMSKFWGEDAAAEKQGALMRDFVYGHQHTKQVASAELRSS
ncbi:MAG: hypothetical protein Q9220_000025 [cf. Caloplaca sp. 1 TL-2023]